MENRYVIKEEYDKLHKRYENLMQEFAEYKLLGRPLDPRLKLENEINRQYKKWTKIQEEWEKTHNGEKYDFYDQGWDEVWITEWVERAVVNLEWLTLPGLENLKNELESLIESIQITINDEKEEAEEKGD